MSLPDFYSMHARKLLGLPEAWRWFSLQAKDGGSGRRFTLITGGIPTKTYTRGPKKGEPNWKHCSDVREVLVSDDEHRRFVAEWERETGLCATCGGSGQVLAGWSASNGATHRPCWKCAQKEARHVR